MKTPFLFPAKFKYLGLLLAIPGFILGYFVVYQNYEILGFGFNMRGTNTLFQPAFENFTNELALTLVIAGLLLIAFSRTKREDELTSKIRQNALYWSILINYMVYACFILLTLTGSLTKYRPLNNITDNIDYTIYGLFLPLIIFIARFYFLLYRNQNEFDIRPVHYLAYSPYRFLGKWISVAIIIIIIVMLAFNESNVAYYLFWALPLSLLIWIYSDGKTEDEYINATRLDAMHLAVYANYAILLLSNMFVYGIEFLLVQVMNFVTIPLIFLAWYYYKLYRISNSAEIKSTYQ